MSSNCAEIREDLVAFVDAELGPEDAHAVRAHLALCAECEAERAALVGSWEALDHLPGVEPRQGWVADVERSILGSRDPGRILRFPRRVAPVLLGIAASVALGAGLTWLLTHEPPPEGSIAGLPAPRIEAAPDPIPTELPAREEAIPAPDGANSRPEDPAGPGQEVVIHGEPEGTGDVEIAAFDDDLDLEGLSDEELELLEDLDVLVLMDELEELDVLENLDLLEDLDPEEFDLDDA